MVPVEFDEPNIVEIIAELDAQPELVKQIQTNNVVNSLLKHDLVYRWEQILTELGMPSTPAMEARKARLKAMADSLLNSSESPLAEITTGGNTNNSSSESSQVTVEAVTD